MCNSKGTFFTPLFSTYNITYPYNFHVYHKPMTLVPLSQRWQARP